MTLDTLNFSGDAVTILGFIGVLSTLFIVVTAFRRFFNSPYNVRVKPSKVNTELPTDSDSTVS